MLWAREDPPSQSVSRIRTSSRSHLECNGEKIAQRELCHGVLNHEETAVVPLFGLRVGTWKDEFKLYESIWGAAQPPGLTGLARLVVWTWLWATSGTRGSRSAFDTHCQRYIGRPPALSII